MALKPEQGDIYTIGLNFAPRQIPHLTDSIDYFHIQGKNEAGVIPYLVILCTCANTGNPTYCSQIVRVLRTGGLIGNSVASGGYVIQKNFNLGTAIDSGIDAQLNYRLYSPPSFAGLLFAPDSSNLLRNEAQPLPGADSDDCAGLFGATCQTINPRWHHLFRTTWDTVWNVSASLIWRYIGGVSQGNNSGDPTLHFAT